MLERIEKIQGIGLLHDVNAKPHGLQKATLIYADNARGKSTLASVLRGAATGIADHIEDRRTIDGTLQPAVVLSFTNGVRIEYAAKKWTKAVPNIVVFDTAFIEDNVHSGGVVAPSHRKNLLQFALGHAAVDARKKEEAATANASKATEAVKQVTAQLFGYQQGMILAAFEKMQPVPDADDQIAALQKRMIVANSAAEVMNRPVPQEVALPPLSLDALFDILQTSLDDIQDDAEKHVREHVARCSIPGLENWISSGLQFDDGKSCPYCAQRTDEVPLLRAYRTHFDAAYAKLKGQVARLGQGLDTDRKSVV